MKMKASHGSKDLTGLCVGIVFSFVNFSMILPLVPLMVNELGGSPSLLGVLMSVTSFASLLIAVPSGMMVQRFGTKKFVIYGSLGLFAGCLMVAAVPSISMLFIAMPVFWIAQIVIIVAAQARVATLGEGRDSSLDFGWYAAATAGGSLFGPLLAGFLIDTAGHRLTWAAAALVAGLTCLAFLLFLGNDRSGEEQGILGFSFDKNIFKRIFNSLAVAAVVSSFAVIFANGAREVFFPLYLKEIGFSASIVGVMLSLRAMASIGVRSVMGVLVKLAGGRFQALIFSLLCTGIGIGTIPFCKNLWTLSLNSIALGFGIGLALPLSMAIIADGVSLPDRGVAMGVRLTGNRLAQLVNPVFFGMVSQCWSLPAAFWWGGILLFAATGFLFFWGKTKIKRTGDFAGGKSASSKGNQ